MVAEANSQGTGPEVVSGLAMASLLLGIGSMAVMLFSVIIAVNIEIVGAVSLFRGLVLPLSAAAVLSGIIARGRLPLSQPKNRRRAALGLIFGAVVLGLVILAIAAVIIIFMPMLFVDKVV
jgi:hypothetical protein